MILITHLRLRVPLALLLTILTTNATSAQSTHKRLIAVRDSIESTTFPPVLSHGEVSTRVGEFSPDGTKFVVILKRGNLETNTNDYSLWLFRTGQRSGSEKPEQILTMSSSSNRAAIQNVAWCSDNETIAFQGESPGQLQQVYSLNIRTKHLHQLTHHSTNIISFTTTPDGRTIAYTAELPAKPMFDEDANRNGLWVGNQSLVELLRNQTGGGRFDVDERIFVQSRGKLDTVSVSHLPTWRETPFISPNAKYVVIANNLVTIPEIWKGYSAPRLHKFVTEHLDPGQYSLLSTYLLIDLATKVQRVLLNAPSYMEHRTSNEVAWSPDSASVAIGRTYLPLDGFNDQPKELLRSSVFIAEVQVSTGHCVPVTHDNVHLLRWGAKRDTLIFDDENSDPSSSGKVLGSDPGRQVAFQRLGSGWARLPQPPLADYRPIVDEADDINIPPHLVIKQAKDQPEKTIMELNPQFANLRFSKVEQIAWTGSDGHEAGGLLYYPIDYNPSKRYPLVIQTHGFNAGRFSIDGIGTWAPFAAQELAAHSIIVLQASTVLDEADTDSPREAPRGMAIYEGAIDYLDQSGMIDRDRVGIIGFSHTCIYVKYALTHSKYHFAAAMVVDGVDGGYFQYVLYRASGSRFSEDFYGGPPIGDNLSVWLERSAGFNTDKVDTPLLVGAPHPYALMGEWEWLSLLRAQNKPVDFVALEDGEHPVECPWERRVLQEYGTVDWFCFWLKGEEDPNLAKKQKYERWRGLRMLQKENVADIHQHQGPAE